MFWDPLWMLSTSLACSTMQRRILTKECVCGAVVKAVHSHPLVPGSIPGDVDFLTRVCVGDREEPETLWDGTRRFLIHDLLATLHGPNGDQTVPNGTKREPVWGPIPHLMNLYILAKPSGPQLLEK